MFSEWLSRNVEKTASSYWGKAVVAGMAGPLALLGLEPYATWRKLPGDAPSKLSIIPGQFKSCWPG